MAVLDEKFKMEVLREAKKRVRQETQGRPEFWDWEDLENIVLDWIIEGIWYKGSLNGLVGRSQIGKTFITVAMCGAVATGTDFMGLKAQQGRVLYVAGEGKSGITKRFKDWCDKAGQDWQIVKGNIEIVTSVDLLNEGHVEDLMAKNAERKYDMVIFDTLSSTSSIENENDSADMWEVMNNGKKVAPDAAVIFVHHPSEATKNMHNPKARGASAFYNDADNLVTITVDRAFEAYGSVPVYSNGDSPLFLTLSTNFEDHGGKSKESEPITVRGLYLSEFKRGHIAADMVVGGYKDPDADQLKKVCEYLEGLGKPITRKSFFQGVYDLAKQEKWEAKSERTTTRVIEKAVSLGWLEEISRQKGPNGAVYERPKHPDLSYLTEGV
jgi:archaellum biogenesis ATPase FlaH